MGKILKAATVGPTGFYCMRDRQVRGVAGRGFDAVKLPLGPFPVIAGLLRGEVWGLVHR